MSPLPATLPAVPEGFTQQSMLHMRASDGSVMVKTIHAPDGAPLPITYRYKADRRNDYEYRGYSIRGSDVIHKSWGALAAAWPTYYRAVQRLVAAGRSEEQAVAELDDTKPLTMVVIYNKPKDHPNGFLARTWSVGPGTVKSGMVLGADLATIEEARALVPTGMVNIGRQPQDERTIAEVWV